MATGLRRSEASEPDCAGPSRPLHANLDTESAPVLSAFIKKYRLCRMSEIRSTKPQPPMRTTIPGPDQIGILYQTISNFDLLFRGVLSRGFKRGVFKFWEYNGSSDHRVRAGCWTLGLILSIIQVELHASTLRCFATKAERRVVLMTCKRLSRNMLP